MPERGGDTGNDDKLDETIDESFPASDAPANTVETGIRTGPSEPPAALSITDNPAESRLEVTVDGHLAFLVYERDDKRFTIIHTEVPPALRGHHVGDALVEEALRVARAEHRRIVAVCPFARAYIRKHPPSQ
jgi:predicted GNAT family acetyltransferase